MRGADEQQEWMFSYISAEKGVPKDHPLSIAPLECVNHW